MNIDPGTITLIQNNFLQHISSAFAIVTRYALNLLYLCTALEIVLFGLAWALQQSAEFSKLFFKILKIGVIFAILQSFPDLLNTILNSFTQLAGTVANPGKIQQFTFNPSLIWQYGYNAGLMLFKKAALGSNMGLIFIEIILGVGILLTFGLLGIQVVLQIISFYLVSLTAVIFLPLGVFRPTSNMFNKAVQSVLQAGVRLMTVIMIIAVASTIWDNFNLEITDGLINLNQSLGLFFTALLFLSLALYLPKIVAATVGNIDNYLQETPNVNVNVAARESTSSAMPAGNLTNMQAATVIGNTSGATLSGSPQMGATSAASTITVQAGSAASGSFIGSSREVVQPKVNSEDAVALASALQKSISDTTAKQVQEILLKNS